MNLLYLLITILKFIGITLLIITLVLLFIIILLLFVPIKYELYINKQDTTYVSAYIKWLYSIISLEIIYESNKTTSHFIKLFGKRILSLKNKKQMQEKKQKKMKKQKQEKLLKKESPLRKQKEIKGKKKYKKPKQKIKIQDMLKQITDFEYKKELLVDTIVWIKNFFKEILPYKLYMELEIGKEDPADTGELMGKLAVLYPFYHSIINFKGNYEKKCFYGVLDASGKFSLGKILCDFIQYIRTKSVKQMIKFTKENRREKKHGRKVTN